MTRPPPPARCSPAGRKVPAVLLAPQPTALAHCPGPLPWPLGGLCRIAGSAVLALTPALLLTPAGSRSAGPARAAAASPPPTSRDRCSRRCGRSRSSG
eukprot:scaffold71379_cov60-Phaeocystis_antarctica.AAC.3